jgi:quinol-cytochrome oxidoreductase complex cytochrome b subunit
VTLVQSRQIVLMVVLVFLAAFAGLTIGAIVEGGPDVLTVLSLLVLALFGFGVVGALRQPPDE